MPTPLPEIYRAFSDRTRLRILNLLLQQPLCVCHVQDVLDLPQVNTSQHLAYLRKAGGWLTRSILVRQKGIDWVEETFLPIFKPVTVFALLCTLVLIFSFQAENITKNWVAVILLAIPILIQVYFNSGLAYSLMRLFKVQHNIATPGSLIGASNFFELAVAVAIALFGPTSPAALATVVGVLVEVPVMLSVCRMCVSSRSWYEGKSPEDSVELANG
jgi:arsenite transporter